MIIYFFHLQPVWEVDAWGTPTEGSALGAFVVFCIALAKGMRWLQLKEALIETTKLAVMIFTIIWGRLNLCPVFRLCGSARGLFSLDLGARTVPNADADLDPVSLCYPWHVYGCDRDDAFNATSRIPSSHCPQRW